VQVIADEMEKRLGPDELATTKNRMTIAARRVLRDETHARSQTPAGIGVRTLIARTDHDPELLDAGAGGFLEDDLERGFRFARRIDQRLQGQRALAGIGGGDKDFSDLHGRVWSQSDKVSRAFDCVEPETQGRSGAGSFPVLAGTWRCAG
jgi:hypothetical protein